jgi:hypothetical protein
MHRRILFSALLAFVCLTLASCFKDEAPNTECDVLEAWVGDEYAGYFSQKSDMHIADVPSGEQQLVFTVRLLSELPQVSVHFNLTPGATITPANGSVQDFSKGPVTYTVTSEDGQWHRTYQVKLIEMQCPSEFDFEYFGLNDKQRYYTWYELLADSSHLDIWATGNEGYNIARPNAAAAEYPSTYDSNGYDGNCVKLTTCNTGSWGKTFKKPIAAGNFFLGAFNSEYALTNTLKTTEMGIPYTKEPIKVAGYYKYSPGEIFTDKDFNELSDRIDEPSIYSVLYLNHDEQGNEVMLHGDDVLSSPYIVRKAEVASIPATKEWTRFEMTFEGSTPIDEVLLANRGYNLALVFSSSKTGDTFEGAVGSTLYIDKVEITFKTE